jgi:hypothetical protein
VDITQQSYKKMLVLGKTTTVVSELVTPRRPDHMILHEELKKYYIATGRDINKDFYNAAHVMVKNWGDMVGVEQIPEKLMKMKYASKTFNNRKGILNAFCEWLVRAGKIKFNPVYDVPSRKKSGSKLDTRKRLSDAEMTLILDTINKQH